MLSRIPIKVELYLSRMEGSVHVNGCLMMSPEDLAESIETQGYEDVAETFAIDFADLIDVHLANTSEAFLSLNNPITGHRSMFRKSEIVGFVTAPPTKEDLDLAVATPSEYETESHDDHS